MVSAIGLRDVEISHMRGNANTIERANRTMCVRI